MAAASFQSPVGSWVEPLTYKLARKLCVGTDVDICKWKSKGQMVTVVIHL